MNRLLCLNINLLIIILLSGGFTKAQETHILKKKLDVHVFLENGKVIIKEKYFCKKYFGENFQHYTKEKFFYSDLVKVSDLQAKSILNIHGKIKEFKVVNIQEKDLARNGVLISGQKEMSFVYPSLQNGSLSEFSYQMQIDDPYMLNMFTFMDEFATDTAEYSISFPENFKINYKLLNVNEIAFVETGQNGIKTFTWKMVNVAPASKDFQAPQFLCYAPQLLIYIDSYKIQDKKINVISNLDDLYHWKYLMLKKTPNENSDSLKFFVNNLLSGFNGDDLGKSRLIFKWVQENIRYIGFENGMEGYVPRPAMTVFKRKYGDCKDMANLLTVMHQYAGLEANVAWIGTRAKPYLYSETPVFYVSNHMICVFNFQNTKIYLDATDSKCPYAYPTAMIQGKEALISIDSLNYKVEKVPLVASFKNLRKDSVVFEVVDNKIIGRFTSSMIGYEKESFESFIDKLKTWTNLDLVNDYFKIGNTTTHIKNIHIVGKGVENNNLKVEFDFEIPIYIKKYQNLLYVNLFFNKQLPGNELDINQRTLSLEFSYLFDYQMIVKFKLPENYSVKYLPKSSNTIHDIFSTKCNYEFNGKDIILNKYVSLNGLNISKKYFDDWNNFLGDIIKMQQEVVCLEKHE